MVDRVGDAVSRFLRCYQWVLNNAVWFCVGWTGVAGIQREWRDFFGGIACIAALASAAELYRRKFG